MFSCESLVSWGAQGPKSSRVATLSENLRIAVQNGIRNDYQGRRLSRGFKRIVKYEFFSPWAQLWPGMGFESIVKYMFCWPWSQLRHAEAPKV